MVCGDLPVVSERMSYQVWLATPGSYQVWLATPGDHSGDGEVRNHWNSNDLQGFPTFCVVRGDPRVVSERAQGVPTGPPSDFLEQPLRRSKSWNPEKPCSTYTFLASIAGPATRGRAREFSCDRRGILRRVPDNLKSLHKRQVLQCRGEFFEF